MSWEGKVRKWQGGSLQTGEMVILGSQYAGEMKKGVFTIMHYLMPKRGILSLHSGCNVGADNDVSLFFGLSGGPSAFVATSCAQVCMHFATTFCPSPQTRTPTLWHDSSTAPLPRAACCGQSVTMTCAGGIRVLCGGSAQRCS